MEPNAATTPEADTAVATTSTPQPNVTVKETGGNLTATVEPTNPLEATDTTPTVTPNATEDAATKAAIQNEWQNQQTTEKAIQEDLTKKGLDFNALAKEYADYGTLSEKSMKALAGAGYPKAVVDAYIEGLEAKTARFVDTVQGFAGGEKGFEQLKTFIKSQPQSVIDGFNAAIISGNLAQIRLTIEGIKASMTRTFGTTNPSIMGNAALGSAVGCTNPADMTRDMSDPRYQVDPVFTREVYQKVQHANFF